jgi:hypothetical protein
VRESKSRVVYYLDDGRQPVDVLLHREEAPQEEVLEALEGRRVHASHELEVLQRELEGRGLEVDVEPWRV